MVEYHPIAQGAHGQAEELQWVRLLSTGDAVKGMLLVFIQKMCTAFHEFEPAWRAGALDEQHLPYFQQRLAGRLERVLEALRSNRLDSLTGYAELAQLERATWAAASLGELAALAEPVHAANHTLSDALEALNTPA